MDSGVSGGIPKRIVRKTRVGKQNHGTNCSYFFECFFLLGGGWLERHVERWCLQMSLLLLLLWDWVMIVVVWDVFTTPFKEIQNDVEWEMWCSQWQLCPSQHVEKVNRISGPYKTLRMLERTCSPAAWHTDTNRCYGMAVLVPSIGPQNHRLSR